MSALEKALWLFPGEIRNTLYHLSENTALDVCEVRLRRGRTPVSYTHLTLPTICSV